MLKDVCSSLAAGLKRKGSNTLPAVVNPGSGLLICSKKPEQLLTNGRKLKAPIVISLTKY
jgi:hypothetical protein